MYFLLPNDDRCWFIAIFINCTFIFFFVQNSIALWSEYTVWLIRWLVQQTISIEYVIIHRAIADILLSNFTTRNNLRNKKWLKGNSHQNNCRMYALHDVNAPSENNSHRNELRKPFTMWFMCVGNKLTTMYTAMFFLFCSLLFKSSSAWRTIKKKRASSFIQNLVKMLQRAVTHQLILELVYL